MKLLFFDDFKLGVLKGDAVVDVSPAYGRFRTPDRIISSAVDRAGRGIQGAPGRRRPSGAAGYRSVKSESGPLYRSLTKSSPWR